MKNFLFAAFVAVFSLLAACSHKTGTSTLATPVRPEAPAQLDTLRKPLIGEEEEEEEMVDQKILEGAEVRPESGVNPDTLGTYNPSHTFEHDLLHTKIEISFDWAKKHANGKATLTLRPWFYPSKQLTLDAKNFDILSVNFEGKTEQLKYTYNKDQLVIDLGKTFTRTEEFKVVITYVAKPDERENIGGSAAITSDKGLYFINADGKETDKPMQIWTQGETESNSCWFPTIDKPNERCTQEMYITVEDKYKTLSNGLLLTSKKNADGTRTDYWKMDKPHAPYLFMMAIGEFAVVKDKWRGIDVDYYVEPAYEQDAREIYPYTTEMLEFFSTKLNYVYPWPKFSQVIVRDYVSGAMENTTAVIFGDFLQKHKRALLDEHWTNEKVVAHEMFHHWFGDLVTTESWANLTLNEGFANYSEYLWLEHKHGRDVADDHEMQEQQGYIFSAGDGGHPLINFGYNSREDMFDAHSYNKGGAVLHMLRNWVGDEAFFAALGKYLKRNEYTDVEAHELRLAFEDLTGQDLSWFWNEWFYAAGHPNLEISYDWDETNKKSSVTIAQIQDGPKVPTVFDLPLDVDIYGADGKVKREQIRLSMRKQTFVFDAPAKPSLINVDATKTTLCVKHDQHTQAEWVFMYQHGPLFRDRFEALDNLQNDESAEAKALFQAALNDPYYGLRAIALQHADPTDATVRPVLAKLAEQEQEPSIRATAISLLGETADKQYVPILRKGLEPSQAYSVVGASLSALTKLDPESAIEASKSLQNDDNEAIIMALSTLYAEKPDRANLSYFDRRMDKIDFMGAFTFFDLYQKMLMGIHDESLTDAGVNRLKAISLNLSTSQWRRFGATKAIADLKNGLKTEGKDAKVAEYEKVLTEIKEKETDPTLKMYYDMF
jgi:aminopeptidase N